MNIINAECLSNKDQFLSLVIERLGKCSIDYAEKMNFIKATRGTREVHSAAGVLLLLHYTGDDPAASTKNGEFIFQLIKRSSSVAQPGDLSCPGGLLHGLLDPILTPLMSTGIIPVFTGDPLKYARTRDRESFRIIRLFLANAVRESWEETGLSPWNIFFLGPVPSYSLLLFRRTIFPLIGFVKRAWHFCPNSEVERLIEIPLSSFLDERNYGLYNVETSSELKTVRERPKEFPCLITRDNQGNEEILWGATFYIIMNFLNIVFNLEIPKTSSKRIINRILGPEYLTGHQNRHHD
jgi:8-oxo-dGTP pyrophosphatase MutT (NUDIX family)